MFIVNAFTGRRITATGKYKSLAVIGMFFMVLGMLLMALITNIPMAVISMIIFGAGLGFILPVLMIAVQNAADSKDLGVATASLQLFRYLGGTMGIAVMGTVLSTSMAGKMKDLSSLSHGAIETLRENLAASLSNVFFTGTLFLTVALVLSFFLKEVPLRSSAQKEDQSLKSETTSTAVIQ
jgi:MFS family permease